MSTIHWAPDLVEEAVFLHWTQAARTDPSAASIWAREREPLYLALPGSGRDKAFQEHARSWFARLRLGEPIEAALRACPRVLAGLPEIDVRRVVRARDEGSEVFGGADSTIHGAKRMVLGVLPHRFLDPAALEEIALRELLYADDMLDPDFGFDPRLDAGPDADPARRELVCDRFRVLWAARVSGRMGRRSAPQMIPPPPDARFKLAFGRGLDPGAIEALFREVWSGGLATYDALLAQASSGYVPAALATSSRSPN
jgi:hypothetical protein